MTQVRNTLRSAMITGAALAVFSAMPATAEMATTVNQAVNLFQNGHATGGNPMTVDAKGPVAISDEVELPKFAFAVYDVDFTNDSLTMTLVADLAKLQITKYDDTTFDRYYFAFDHQVHAATLSDATDANFKATVETVDPGTHITSAGAFMDGMGTEFTFENGGILITIGEGTDLTKILENGGVLTVDF